MSVQLRGFLEGVATLLMFRLANCTGGASRLEFGEPCCAGPPPLSVSLSITCWLVIFFWSGAVRARTAVTVVYCETLVQPVRSRWTWEANTTKENNTKKTQNTNNTKQTKTKPPPKNNRDQLRWNGETWDVRMQRLRATLIYPSSANSPPLPPAHTSRSTSSYVGSTVIGTASLVGLAPLSCTTPGLVLQRLTFITCWLVRYIGWSGHCALLFTSLAIRGIGHCSPFAIYAVELGTALAVPARCRASGTRGSLHCTLQTENTCLCRPCHLLQPSSGYWMWSVLCGQNGTNWVLMHWFSYLS